MAVQTATASPTVCDITFSDVPPSSTFYSYVTCLACRGVISGYADGTFRTGADVTRGQISKMVSQAAGFDDDPGSQLYQDVSPSDTFYTWINRLSRKGIMNGYPCGGQGEGCVAPANLPYFRPYDSASRGQIAKIAVNAAVVAHPSEWLLLDPTASTFQDVPVGSPFFRYVETAYAHGVLNGYACGSTPAGQCLPPANKPYFLPGNNVTRGEVSKIVANSFSPGCQTQ